MGTSTLLVEIVIIGFQTLVWILLLLFTVLGYDWINLAMLKDWSASIVVGLVAVSYTFGIVFDSVAASLFAPWSSRAIRHLPSFIIGRATDLGPSRYDSPALMRSHIRIANPVTNEHLEKMYNEIRLLRSTSINILLISITSIAFIATRVGITWLKASFILLVLLSLSGLSIWTWFRRLRSYYYELKTAYELLQTPRSLPRKKSKE